MKTTLSLRCRNHGQNDKTKWSVKHFWNGSKRIWPILISTFGISMKWESKAIPDHDADGPKKGIRFVCPILESTSV